jgi:general secretion pathway protein D
MENRAMRKILLALLIGSVATIQFKSRAEQLMADAATNFEPANRSGTAPVTPEAPAPSTVTSPAPKRPAAAPSKSTAPPATAPALSPAASTTAQDEVIRRQAAQIQARVLIDEGQKLFSAGKFDQAIPKLDNALKLLPRAKVTEADSGRATRLLADSYTGLANAALAAKDYPKANAMAKKALEYDPHDNAAENIIVKAKKGEIAATQPPVMPEPNATPEFQAEKGQIRALFREGKLLLNSGQYDEAEKRFQQVLLLDRYNTDAYELLQQVNAARASSTIAGAEANRSRMLWEAERKWSAPISGEVKTPDLAGSGSPLQGSSAASTAILLKLNEIIFPEIKFREATITDVIQYLSDESRKIDPKKQGVNIVLGAGIGGGGTAPTPSSAPGEGGAPPPTLAPTTGSEGAQPITLSLRDVPMIEALKYITSLANLKYRIESSAVLIVSTNEPAGQMITRTFQINPGVFIPYMDVTNRPAATQQTQTTGGGGGGASQSAPASQAGPASVLPDLTIAVLSSNQVRQVFLDAGVEFPTGSALFYFGQNSTLIIRNTPENMELIERVLAVLNSVPAQIEIEARYVEIGQKDLDELGFKWKVGPYNNGDVVIAGGSPGTSFLGTPASSTPYDLSTGLRGSESVLGNAVEALLTGGASAAAGGSTVGSVRGILTNPQFELLINALSQKSSADVLSAPKVTTISGAQAQIRVAQEFIYPTTYTPATVVPGQSAGAGAIAEPVITPSTPSAFAMRPVGVILNVTPTVGADGYTINLSLIPQVTDFLGFIQYGSTLTSGGASVLNDIRQPLFSTRDVVTSVEIWDGQTVVLGGLIREDVQKVDDKIPFLGDLPGVGRVFRSKVTQRTKRNLLIFVTARLIDPAGRPIHKETLPGGVR